MYVVCRLSFYPVCYISMFIYYVSAHHSLSRLIPLLTTLSISDPTDDKLFESLSLIRSRFKTLIVMLGVHMYFKRQQQEHAQGQGQGEGQGQGQGQITSTPKHDMSF